MFIELSGIQDEINCHYDYTYYTQKTGKRNPLWFIYYYYFDFSTGQFITARLLGQLILRGEQLDRLGRE